MARRLTPEAGISVAQEAKEILDNAKIVSTMLREVSAPKNMITTAVSAVVVPRGHQLLFGKVVKISCHAA